MAKANKLIPVVDGTAGTPIELIDSRIDINNPTNEDVLMYNSLSGKFEANSIPPIPDSTSDLTNDSGFITANDVPQEVFECTFANNDGTYSMDKDPDEIYEAVVVDKKVVICKFNAQILYCYYATYDNNSYSIKFSQINVEATTGHFVAYIWNNGNTWYYRSGNLQRQLVDSGTNQNIKTINGNSLLGSGDIHISGDILIINAISYNNNTWKLPKTPDELISLYSDGVTVIVDVAGELFYRGPKQDPRFFSTNGLNALKALFYYDETEDGLDTIWYKSTTYLQSQLDSGVNIKTINGNSLLGSGDLTVESTDVFVCNFNGAQMDKTPQQIYQASQEGKVVVCFAAEVIFYGQYIKYYSQTDKYDIEFVSFPAPHLNSQVEYIVYNGSNWLFSSYLNQKLLIDSTTALQGQTPNIKTINNESILGSGNLTVGGSVDTLNDLDDVAISSPSDQQTLVYNPDTQYFENGEQRKLWNGVDVVSKLDSDYPARNGYIANATGAWNSSTSYKHWIVPVKNMRTVTVQANSSTASYYTFFSAYTPSSSSAPTTTYATGYTNTEQVAAGTSSVVNVPTDAIYMYFNTGSSNAAKPAHIYLTGIAVTPIPIIPFGTCSDSSATTKIVTIPNVDSYYEGLLIRVTNSSTACSGTVTLNVNGLGAKPVRCSHNGSMINVGSFWRASLTFIMSYSTANTTTGRFDVIGLDFDTKSDWNAASGSDAEILNKPTIPDPLPSMTGNSGKILAVNSGATGVEWVNQSSGGTAPKETMRVTCSTATATSVKEISITGYEPQDGDLISVYFSNAVGDGASLSINSGTNMGIIAMGTSIVAGIINAGDTATFSIKRTSPSRAYLLSIDRASVVAATMPAIPDELNDLSDVSVASPVNSKALIYDNTEQKWICEKIYYTFNVFYSYNSTTDTFTVTNVWGDGESVTLSEIIQKLNAGRPVRCSLSMSGTGMNPIPIGFYLYPRDDTDNGVFTNTYYDKIIKLNGNQNDEWYLSRESIISNRVNVYSGSSAPASALGSNGDIYIQTQS